MAAILQTIFSNAFSWMNMYKFRLRFHWSLLPGVQLKIFIGSDIGLAAAGRQAIIWTYDSYLTDAYLRHSASIS